MKTKLFTLLLAVAASVGMMRAAIIDGTCGENLTWSLNTKDSTLTIEGTGAMTSAPWSEHKSYIAHVNIQEGLTTIANNAFMNCTSMTSITIPNSVKNIENGDVWSNGAFRGCKGLISVTFGNRITSIGECAFYDCSSLTSIIIPNSVTNIGAYAFRFCKNLTSVTIGSGVTSIGDNAFDCCTGLTSIEIPNSVTSIGDRAFDDCSVAEIHFNGTLQEWFEKAWSVNQVSSNYALFIGNELLDELVIPNNITCIKKYALYGCTSLTSVTISNSVTSIESYALGVCNLSSITCKAITPPSMGTEVFTSFSATLFVPKESIEAYQNALYWEEFSDIRAIGSAPLVLFLDWDGAVLSSAYVNVGSAATPPANPTREGYTFTGWDKDFSNITGDLTVTAQYKINRYKVDFVNWDATIIKSDSVEWNTAAIAPANPSRDGFTFIGWDKDFSNVTANLVIIAQYDFGENKNYTINFNTKDGDEILSNNIILKVPSAPEIIGFTFVGWRPVSKIIDSDTIEVEAVYESDEPSSAPAVVINPSNPAQKLIREGNVYILTSDHTFDAQGKMVK